MGSINFFKSLSTFLLPAPLINLSNFNNFSSEASLLPLCYAAQDISILALIKRPQDLKGVQVLTGKMVHCELFQARLGCFVAKNLKKIFFQKGSSAKKQDLFSNSFKLC